MGNIKIKFRLRALLYVFILLLLCIVKTKSQDATQALTNLDRRFFIENKGQWPDEVLYLTRMGGLDVWITKQGVNYTFYKIEKDPNAPKREEGAKMPEKFRHHPEDEILIGHRVIMDLVGSNANPQREGKQKQEGYYNYLIGNDPSKHATYVGLYKEAIIKNVYEGIDVRYYFDKGGLRYDYIVQPGADPNQIIVKLRGQEKEYLKNNNIIFTTRFGEVQMRELSVYQSNGKKVEAMFICKNNQWRIALGKYDQSQPLIIDPLIYSTYIGGSVDDRGYDIALDGSGNAYITGYTSSSNYDVTTGTFQTVYGQNIDVFVTKLNATGTSLVYSTYLGGSNSEGGYGIALDGNGNVYVTGMTSSSNYDVTTGAFQTTYGGGGDVFVTKLNATGTSLLYSTYLGGSSDDKAYGIALDANGYAYVMGYTASINYPVTPGAFQTTHEGGYYDVFVTKLNPTGTSLVYSTYLGGNNSEEGYGIALDANGYAYVTGKTFSSNFDVTTGAFQTTYGGDNEVFVTKLCLKGVTLTSAPGTDNQTVCINTPITTINYSTLGVTNIGTTTGLPDGLMSFSVFNTLSISGTPTESGTFNYTIPMTVDCGTIYVTGTIIVEPDNTFTLTSVPGTDNQTACLNTAITDITYATNGATGIGTPTGLPAGITANFLSDVITISGSPTELGTFNYTIPLTGGCGNVSINGMITIEPDNTVTLSSTSSDNQTVCVNTPIADISYVTTGATGIGTPTGLPAGVTASFASDTITISGTPTESGTFNYSIPLTGGCGNVNATGTIIVNPDNMSTALASASGTDHQTLCINTSLSPIIYTTVGATGIGVPVGLPTGVTASWNMNVLMINGTPSESGTFNYSIPLTGGCGNVSATGTITVIPDNTASLLSSAGTDSQTVCVNTAITSIEYTTTGATGIGTPTNLPAGVTANWSANVILISGTPTQTGIFNYSIPMTGGCGNVNVTNKLKKIAV